MSDTVKIAIQGDAKGLVAAAKAGDKALDGLGDQAKVTGREIDGMGQEVRTVETQVERMSTATERASRSMHRLGGSASTIRGIGKLSVFASEKIANNYTSLAGGVGIAMAVKSTAELDLSLIRIKQTANASREEMLALRSELFRLSTISGKSVEDLAGGFDELVQAGQSWKAATAEIGAINVAMSVSPVTASALAGGLRTASEAYHIDLAEPGKALELLDKVRVAGKAGSAELDKISDIFARIGPSAASSGMGLDQALSFVEVLSKTEANPERLATLSDSVLRLFNNLNYQKAASKATGVSFYNKDGSKRNVLAVLEDLRKQYQKLKNDLGRDKFIQKAFGKADLDTIKGLRILLSGDALERMASYQKEIQAASGTLEKEQGEAMGNLVKQVERLIAVIRGATDGFTRPIVDVLTKASNWAADNPGVTKGALIAGTGVVGAAALVMLGSKIIESIQTIRGFFPGSGGVPGVGGILGGMGARVFVTNMPGGGLLGAGGAGGGFGGGAPIPGVPGRAAGAVRFGRLGSWMMRPAMAGVAAGAFSLYEYGNTVEGWGGMAGGILGAEAGAKLGAFGGPMGVLVGTAAGAVIGSTIAPWLSANVAESKKAKADAEASDFLDQLDAGRMRFDGAAADATARPIQINLTNQVDTQGRTTTTVTGSDVARVDFKSKAIVPDWAKGDL